ncbi:MAG: TIGR01777 family oxidoreductase [Ilumatobacteraceae bacterium]
MHVVVTGSSGLIGSALAKRLSADGHEVTPMVRRTPRPGEARWSPAEGTIDRGALTTADAVINLSGAGIGDHRWTDEYKRELVDSRLRGTELLAATIAEQGKRPAVFLSGSAIGIYGARDDSPLDESSDVGTGFLADLCVRWEAATAAAAAAGIRVVHLRTGIVLSSDGGALKKQLPLFKLGLGGKMGSGKQFQSWITIDDEVGSIMHLLTSADQGAVNLTAPTPVTQATFAKTLAHVLGRPSFLPIPTFGPKLLLGGELADNLLFTGQRVVPAALEASGYRFQHPTLEAGLRHVLQRPA